MLVFISSIFVSALFTGVMLVITRRRLGRQFDNIERRQIEIERAVAVIKLGIERSTTDAQLRRLHLGFVRLQENAARRYGELLSPGPRSRLSELDLSALGDWAAMFGGKLESGQIEKWARAIERAEILEGNDIDAAMPDLVAEAIALSWRLDRRLSVGVTGAAAESRAAMLRRVFSGSPREITISEVSGESTGMGPLDVLIITSADAFARAPVSLLGSIKEGGLLVTHGAANPPAAAFDGFGLLAAEWETQIYQKRGASPAA